MQPISAGLITKEYCSLNEQLHNDNKEYGTSGKKHASDILNLAIAMKTQDILDYGCGKSTLAMQLPFKIKQYDPAIPKYSELTMEQADIVVCTDVLEHIEPDSLHRVLSHLMTLVKKVGYFTIANRPAKKTLADGRNAHLIIKPSSWWIKELLEYFDIVNLQVSQGEMLAIVERKSPESFNA